MGVVLGEALDWVTTKLGKIAQIVDPAAMWDRIQHDAWVFGLVILLEVILLGARNSTLARLFARDAASARVDLVNFVLYYAGISFVLGLLLSFNLPSEAIDALRPLLAVDWTWLTDPYPGAAVLLALAAVLLGDFLYYVYHRLMHTRYLWHFHRFHHAAEEFVGLTSVRDHPVEKAIKVIPYGIAAAILGAPIEALALVYATTRFISVIHHSKFDSDWGWVGRWLFVSPRTHMIHHSVDPRHYDSNYGFVTPIWDRLFGTFEEDRDSHIVLGLVPSQTLPQSWFKGVWVCQRDFFVHVLRDLGRWINRKQDDIHLGLEAAQDTVAAELEAIQQEVVVPAESSRRIAE